MLGGYELVQRLSEGASAEVFLARPSRSREQVIVEVLRPELFREAELTGRFLDEARARKALSHPNVARRVREGTTEDGRPYLVTEPVGERLSDRLQNFGPLDLETALKMMLPLCDALHYLHQRGHIHGNLKPSSVHLGADGTPQRPKLVDYGLALFRPGRTMPRPPGRILVEPEYMSPERNRGQRGMIASDIYSLGLLMFEALTGAPPFTGTPEEVRRAHQEAPVPPLPPSCERVAPILARCLAKSPEARFASALEVREALAAQLDGTLPLPAPMVGAVAVEPEARPETGDMVGRYVLLEPIGEGGMGRVFLARHARLGRMVALKLLKPEHAMNRDQVERFVREARAVNRIRNEHIVEIFDLVDEAVGSARRVYCVMELLRGRSLGEVLTRGPVPIERAVNILRQVAFALESAHRAGVVHRDVKPDNIFLTEKDGQDFAKVVDFGVAKLKEHAETLPPRSSRELPRFLNQTVAGTVVGTPAYMAPEQVMGRPFDHRVDVYALGVVLYKLVTGATPFPAPDFAELSRKIAFERPPELPAQSASGDPVPPALATLIQDCLEKDPTLRPQSAAMVAQRLERIHLELVRARSQAEDDALPTIEGQPVEAAASLEAARSRWQKATAVAGAIAAAVAIVVFISPARRGDELPAASGGSSVQGDPVRLSLRSEPAGAEIYRLDTGERLGRTPANLQLPRADQELRLRFDLKGYQSAEVDLSTRGDASAQVVLRPKGRRR